jgi:hypothetical protein
MVLFRTKRRVVVNGRLVESATVELRVHWSRFFALFWSSCILWFSNPYNNPDVHMDGTTFAGPHNHWTNYGLFSVRDRRRGDGFTVYALGQDFTCYYDYEICRTLKDVFCHERPLLFDSKNWSYTAHHLLMFVYVLMGCLRWCSNLDDLVHQDTYGACLLSLFVPRWTSWFEARWFLFPAWERMGVLVPRQQSQTAFRLFESDGANYAWSVTFFYLVSALCLYLANGNRWATLRRTMPPPTTTNPSLLHPSSCLNAVALGFVRGSLAQTVSSSYYQLASNRGRLRFPPFPVQMSSLSATWTLLAVQVAAGGIPALLPWWSAHMVGTVMGTYQFQNQELVKMVDSLWTGLIDSFQSLFQF